MAAKKSVKSVTKSVPSKKASTASFIRDLLKKGKLSDKAILAAARKRAPKQKIGDNYVSWYRCQMKAS